MGQKCNPVGVRLKINRSWDSNWYADGEYGNYLIEDLKIRSYIRDKVLKNRSYNRVELSDMKIRRIGKAINIYIYTSRPGLLIGKKGHDIEKLRAELAKIVKTKINLNINEVKKIDLDAKIIAQSVGKAIQGRVAYKRAMKQAITRAMKSGAKGVKIQVAGRLGGADMARREYFKEGSIPLHTFEAQVDFGKYNALTTYGIIGISVWVHHGLKSKRKFDSIDRTAHLVNHKGFQDVDA